MAGVREMIVQRRDTGSRWGLDRMPDQHGRTFVVTGANAGIGFETTKALVEAGATVVMAVRNEVKGERAARSLTGPGKPVVATLDVSDLSSVRRFVAGLDGVLPDGRLDVLVNNAGILGVPFSTSVDGHELHFATNHLGHFLLVELLRDRIMDRVVITGSNAHRGGDLDLEDLGWTRRRYAAFSGYQASKLANLQHLGELTRRLSAAGSTLRAVGAHPGTTSTEIATKSGNRLLDVLSPGHKLIGMSVAQGALTTLYAATMDVPTNTYIGPDGLKEYVGYPTAVGRSSDALDPDAGKALWAKSAELVGV